MPMMRVGERFHEVHRMHLSPQEAATVLRCELKDVRNMLRRGDLRDVGTSRLRRVDPEQLARLVEARVAAGELSHVALVDLRRLVTQPPARG